MLTTRKVRILLLFDPHSPRLQALLRHEGYVIALSNSQDHALRLCRSQRIKAVLIDQCCLGKPEGWSIAPSFKKASPQLGVILLLHGPVPNGLGSPTAVDWIVSDANLGELLEAVRQCVTCNVKH